MKPYYGPIDGVTIYHGDCREVLPLISADAVITDPPYNCGMNYGELTDDNLPWPEWCAWFDGVITVCQSSAPDVCSFLSQTAGKKYERHGQHERDWCLVWEKPLSMAICAAPFMPHWEPIFYWGKAKRTKDGGARFGSDVIKANVEVGLDRWNHPTPKPLLVMLQLVEKFPGVILDPFAGSGTTLAAAKMLQQNAIGVEISEQYCEVIARRLEETKPLFRSSQQNGTLPLEMGA